MRMLEIDEVRPSPWLQAWPSPPLLPFGAAFGSAGLSTGGLFGSAPLNTDVLDLEQQASLVPAVADALAGTGTVL